MSKQVQGYILMCVRLKMRSDRRGWEKLSRRAAQEPAGPERERLINLAKAVERRIAEGEAALRELEKNQNSS